MIDTFTTDAVGSGSSALYSYRKPVLRSLMHTPMRPGKGLATASISSAGNDFIGTPRPANLRVV